MLGKIKAYATGLIFSYLAVIAFAAFGWINVGAGYEKFQALAIIAALLWTITYLACFVIWAFLALLAGFTMGIGALIGMGFVAYILVKVVAYLLPPGFATFTQVDERLFVIGLYYCIASIVFRSEDKKENAKSRKKKESPKCAQEAAQ